MGNMYLWGNISNYVVTYYHYKGDENATLNLANLLVPISITIQVFANPIGAFLVNIYSPKFLLFIGVSIMCSSILAASCMSTWNGFMLCYGIGFPLGIGTCYWVPIMCGWEWFPNNKGFITGLILCGYGFGAFIFGFITTSIANPENLKVEVPEDGSGDTDKLFPESVGLQVPYMFRFCLVIWAILGLLSVLGVSRNPSFVNSEKVRIKDKLIQRTTETTEQSDDLKHINFIGFKEGLLTR